MAVALTACKPANEPPRRPATAGAASRDAPDALQRLTAATTLPLGTGSADAGGVDAGGRHEAPIAPPTVDAGPTSELHALARRLGLEPALVEQLQLPPGDDARAAAQTAVERAVEHQRKLDLGAAEKAYGEAIAVWPGHPAAHLGLAGVSALRGQVREALHHLRVLAAVPGEAARDSLVAARTHRDFEGLRTDATFRELTGYVAVGVSWSPATSGQSAARQVVADLRGRHIPAELLGAHDRDVTATTLFVEGPDDPTAERMADEVQEVLRPLGVERATASGTGEHPLVLVLAPTAALAADHAASRAAPADFVGLPLVVRRDGAADRLQLKSTGFFTWERSDPDGRRMTRTGRYVIDGSALHLDYRQVVETPGQDPARPDVQVEQGRRSQLTMRVAGDALEIDGVAFRPE